MRILQARMSDSSRIMNLFSDVVKDLNGRRIYQWDNQYPNPDIILNDIQQGCLFVYIDESSIGGAISINEEQENEYTTIDWNDQGKFLCIHRLVVHPQSQGKGIGKRLLQFAIDVANQNGCTSIRLDAYTGNPIALNLYEHNGFVRMGELFFPRRELPFIGFEKILR